MLGNRSSCHLLVEMPAGPRSPGVAIGWRTSGVMSDSNIWRLSLSGPGVATGPPARFIASTRSEEAAQYSPDGKRIAFESDRSGVHGIWVSDADGSNAVELFSPGGGDLRDPALVARWATYRLRF